MWCFCEDLKEDVEDNMICLIKSCLYKVVCRLDCHIQKTKAGKYRDTCAEHVTKFFVAMSYGSKRKGVKQRQL
jgi:hypothetical protein